MSVFSKKEVEVLKKVLAVYTEEYCAALPTKAELSATTFSPEFEDKIQQLINKQKKFYYYWLNTARKRAAAIILAILISLTTVTFSVKAIREPFIQFIVETFEKFSSIIFADEPEVNNSNIIVDAELEKIVPEYIPAGYTIESEIEDFLGVHIKFSNQNDTTIVYSQTKNDGIIAQADTENTDYEKIIINNCEGVSYTKDGVNNIVFNTENYVFTISSAIDKTELIKIAESIKIN